MKYDLFLFDLDDTLLDFQKSERLSFFMALQDLGLKSDVESIFQTYQVHNKALWKLFEQNLTTKDHLKVERFRQTFASHQIDINPEVASLRYLDALPETVVLIDHAVELCEWLKSYGEIGIITNGIHHVQTKRIANSAIAKCISFISVSDECGFAKPDVRFFDYTVKKAKHFNKSSTLIVGDRFDADIQGAHNFGIDSCWFNPHAFPNESSISATYEIKELLELRRLLEKQTV